MPEFRWHDHSKFREIIMVSGQLHQAEVGETSDFSRLLERSAEVLALYSGFHSLLLLGGLLNNLGLSFRTRWTVRPYLAFEQGVSQVQEIQPPAWLILGHLNFILPLAASTPSRCIRNPEGQIGTPSLSIVLDFKLEDGRHRSTKMWYCRLYHILMLQHLDAWDLPSESTLRKLILDAA